MLRMSLAALVCLQLVLCPGQVAADNSAADKPVAQKSTTKQPGRYTAEAFDEEMIAGHPDGEPLAMPDGVSWNLDKAEVASTARRSRLSLAGKWRFAAQPAKDTETLRKQMGWLEMPAANSPSEWKAFDDHLQPTTTFGGKPIASQGWAWIEREVHTPIEWVRSQVYLVVRGPWSEAEVFVGYLPVKGERRDGGTWFEITENLTYGGDCPLTMRLDLKKAAKASSGAEPFIGLELLPTGPRFNGLEVRQNPQQGELELDIDLRRPKFILNLPMRLKDIPLIVQVRLDDAATGEMIQRFDQHIGPMPEETRNVKLRAAWSKQGGMPPERMRLRTRLTSVYGGNMDVDYPLVFEPQNLEKAAEGSAN